MKKIKEAVMPLVQKYDLIKVDIFGSYADGKATEKSDVDFLVEFKKNPPSIFKVLGLRDELVHALGSPVDILTSSHDKRKIKIEKVITVYESA